MVSGGGLDPPGSPIFTPPLRGVVVCGGGSRPPRGSNGGLGGVFWCELLPHSLEQSPEIHARGSTLVVTDFAFLQYCSTQCDEIGGRANEQVTQRDGSKTSRGVA